jgi:hypothetical protein
LLFYVETEFGKNFLESLNIDGLQVHVFPYLAASLCVAHAAPRSDDDGPITFGIVGDTRGDRGVQFFPRLIGDTQDLAAQCRWKLQIDRKALAAIAVASDAAYVESAFQCANASIVEGTLTSAEYFALLRQEENVRWIVRNQKTIKAELHDLKNKSTRRYPSEEFYDLVTQRLAEIK